MSATRSRGSFREHDQQYPLPSRPRVFTGFVVPQVAHSSRSRSRLQPGQHQPCPRRWALDSSRPHPGMAQTGAEILVAPALRRAQVHAAWCAPGGAHHETRNRQPWNVR
jgi:hypothetical protein